MLLTSTAHTLCCHINRTKPSFTLKKAYISSTFLNHFHSQQQLTVAKQNKNIHTHTTPSIHTHVNDIDVPTIFK